jgi:cytochrome c oxidase assembly protein Cox11
MTTTPKPSDLTTTDLVALFVKYAVQQDEAILGNEQQTLVNKLVFKIKAIWDELKSRPGDQRSALISLFDHPNPNVRVWAATATLAIAPATARAVLEDLSKNCFGPQRLEAGMRLKFLDDGTFKPT